MSTQDTAWEPMHEHVSKATALGNSSWCIEYIRDFIFSPNTSPVYRWSSYTAELSQLTRAYLYSIPLTQFPIIGSLFAHTCIGFLFEDGTELLYSVEARIKKGSAYRPWQSADNVRIVATLNYFIGFRHTVRKQGFYRYPLTIPSDTAQKLFRACMEDSLAMRGVRDPYHSFFNQCTTSVRSIMNTVLEKKLPPHPFWHFSRFAHHILASRKMIAYSEKETL